MDVYIVRHGAAVDIGTAGIQHDADRTLSDTGREKTAQAARGMRAAGCAPEVILSSPLVRARETAEIVARGLEFEGEIAETELLTPEADPRQVVTFLNKQVHRDAMLVGHMPNVADLASCLLVGEEGTLNIEFKKAACACVEFDGHVGEGTGSLKWYLPPRVLRRMG